MKTDLPKDGVAVIEIEPEDLDFAALAAMNFTPFCECPKKRRKKGCCVRARYHDGPTVEDSTVVIEQENERFYLVRSPYSQPGYYVVASGSSREIGEPVYFRPGRPPKARIFGQRYVPYPVYRLPPELAA